MQVIIAKLRKERNTRGKEPHVTFTKTAAFTVNDGEGEQAAKDATRLCRVETQTFEVAENLPHFNTAADYVAAETDKRDAERATAQAAKVGKIARKFGDAEIDDMKEVLGLTDEQVDRLQTLKSEAPAPKPRKPRSDKEQSRTVGASSPTTAPTVRIETNEGTLATAAVA